MTCCAAGSCAPYLAAIRDDEGWPLEERTRRLQRACWVCWWGDQPQPETLFARTDRLEREAKERARRKALGLKAKKPGGGSPEEHYGNEQLRG